MPERPVVRQTSHPTEPWFSSEAIAAVLALEQRQAIREIADTYGQCALQLSPGASAQADLSGHHARLLLRLHRHGNGLAGDLRCHDAALPLASASVALVYAQHVLETAEDCQALIAELVRVLVPEGLAVFIVFNPFRPFRLRWQRRALRAIPVAQLAGLLREQGLEINRVRPVGPCWRARSELASAGEIRVPWLAGSYLLVARKRLHGVTPLRVSGQRVALNAGMGAG